ncbi:acyl carrier protein (ACP) (modular protein) [Mesorhizobium plurifarium]|uniref:Acyl carrier protein n=1 Tax=Mesorhizobium plurifarium TaxID=69974 RepID=A0A090EA79_MESPL|nr:acyl carrier protein (ACP) (modular protein) [Mesorhizobium plurifarium]
MRRLMKGVASMVYERVMLAIDRRRFKESMATEVDPRLKSILVDTLGDQEVTITGETKLEDDLLADSLDIVRVVMAIEEEFSIEINDDQMFQLVTVGDVAQLISKLTAENSSYPSS